MRSKLVFVFLAALLFVFIVPTTSFAESKNPKVVMETNMGNITIELFVDKAPITVENFLKYVREGFYDGLIFHRVIPGFVIQGGGMLPDLSRRNTHDPIKNEADNGLKNTRTTLSMARTSVVDSATSQFFINLVDNKSLDHKNNTKDGYGYAVFGKVVEGMDVVDEIAKVPTGTRKGFSDVPKEDIVVKKAYELK